MIYIYMYVCMYIVIYIYTHIYIFLFLYMYDDIILLIMTSREELPIWVYIFHIESISRHTHMVIWGYHLQTHPKKTNILLKPQLKHGGVANWHCTSWNDWIYPVGWVHFSPPARWGLLDFMSVACSSPLLLLLNRDPRRTVFSVGPQPRPSTPSVPCRTSTTTIPAQCSLPDLNHDHPRPVFPAGPQPRPSPPSVPCRTSTTTIHAQCSLPDLNREYPRQVFPAGPHVGRYGTKNAR